MARRESRTYRTAAQARAKVLAARRELLAEEEPMRRWSHPIPPCLPPVCPTQGEETGAQIQVLEQLQCQNQLLVDLLGAVNSLTAAVLCRGKS